MSSNLKKKKVRRVRIFSRLLLLFLISTGCTVPSNASADILGYPNWDMPCEHSPYNATGKCANYDWGPLHTEAYDHSSEYSSRGYTYRNCTDYVAWKLQSLGVPDSKTRGLGNGGWWYNSAPANEQSLTPKTGDAAVVPGTPGHVAFVESVNSIDPNNPLNDNITVSEYNYLLTGEGGKRTGKASTLGFTRFVDFDLKLDNSDTSSAVSQSLPSGSLYLVQHWNSPSGMTEVKQFNSATQYSSWAGGWVTADGWHGSSDNDYGLADYDRDGKPDLYTIRHDNTPNGMTNVAILSGASSFTSWIGGWVSPEGAHSGNDVHYVVGDYDRDGRPDVFEILHWNSPNGRTQVRVWSGALNFGNFIGGWSTPEGWHGGADVDYVLSSCGATGPPNIFQIMHNNSPSGMTEVKEFTGASNYQSYGGGWVTPEGRHGGGDVDYVASGCNPNGMPNIYEILHNNSSSGMTELHGYDGSHYFQGWLGGWVTADGWHGGNDVSYVMTS
jgi:surface antigen